METNPISHEDANPVSHEDAKQAFLEIALADGKTVTVALKNIVLLKSDNESDYQTLVIQGEEFLVTQKVYNEIFTFLNRIFYIFRVGVLPEEEKDGTIL